MKSLFVIGVVGAAILMPTLAAKAEDQGATAAPSQPVVINQVPAPNPTATIPPKVKKEVVLQDLTLTGKVTREEVQNKKGAMVTQYFLNDASGTKIALPTPQASKKDPAAMANLINLGDYVDANVKVAAKGTETVSKKVGKLVNVSTIVSIEKIP